MGRLDRFSNADRLVPDGIGSSSLSPTALEAVSRPPGLGRQPSRRICNLGQAPEVVVEF